MESAAPASDTRRRRSGARHYAALFARRSALPDKLVEYLREQKTQDPDASVPEILRRAKENSLIAAGMRVHRATAWRAVKLSDWRRRAQPQNG